MQPNVAETSPDQSVINQPTNQASSPEPQLIQGKGSRKSGIIVLVLFLLIALGAAGYFGYSYYQLQNRVGGDFPEAEEVPTKMVFASPTEAIAISSPTAPPDSTTNWQIYKNDDYGFSFKYPANFTISQLVEKPFYSLKELVEFGVVLTQDIYTSPAQIPQIRIQLVKTTGTVAQILDQLKLQLEATPDPQSPYYGTGATPAEIKSIVPAVVGSVEAVRVERYRGPGGPHAQVLEYYLKSEDYVFVLGANYGTNNPDFGQDGSVEKETLEKLILTFKLFD
ncbi:hypothetical protein ACFLZP_04875 [Patescibacteria group bacterium]